MYNEQPKPFVWTKTTDEILAWQAWKELQTLTALI